MAAPIITLNKKQKNKGSFFYGVLFIGAVALILSFITPEKKMKVELTDKQWIFGDRWINVAKNALSHSELPAKDVSMILDSITAFQNSLYQQLNPQFKVEDSLSKIKPK